MFAIIAAVAVMFGLSLGRVPVVFALVIGALTGGLLAGLGVQGTLDAFNNGLAAVLRLHLLMGCSVLSLRRLPVLAYLIYLPINWLKV